ncbi:MAG TPA: cupin domain-containing protein [Steroidobacteraceae bacterium]|nr:cupin domain-containing protein [Steroidobacteraceae bacterium]
MDLPDVEALVRALALEPHPEGGYFRETYRSGRLDTGGRPAATMIYYLLPRGQVSRLHRIDADEGWHLYLGGPLEIFEFDEHDPDASPRITMLGRDLEHGESPQHLVPAGRWFGAALGSGAHYALVGCTVAPGFDFSTFELGSRVELMARFPAALELIRRLT